MCSHQGRGEDLAGRLNIRPNDDEVAIDEAESEGGHLKATTVTLPVFKSLSLTTLCGFLDFRNRAV